MEANEKINDSENKSISNFLNDVFSAALKDVTRQKEDLNIKNEKKEQKINLENNQIDINNINENNSNHNNEMENKTSSNNINDKNDFNKNLKIQSAVNLKINSNYLNYEEKENLKNLNLCKIINLIKYKNKFLLFRKIERAITKNDEEFNKEIQPHFKSTMKIFKEKEEKEEKDFLEKEQLNPIINPVEIIKTQNSNNEEEEISFKEQKNQNLEENNSDLNNNIDYNNNNNNFSSNSQLLNENQNNENNTVKRIVNDDEFYNKEFIPLIKNCYKEYKKEEEEVEEENKIEVNPIINPVNILNTNNTVGENESKRSSLKNEESKEEYVKNLNENNFNSTASFNKSTLYTTTNLNQQNLNKVNNNNNINNKNNKKENVFNKPIENKNFKRIKLNYNFPYNKIYNMFKDHSYKLPVKYSENKQKIKEEKNNNAENLSFKNSVNTNNSFYNTNMKESNLNRSVVRNNSLQIIKKFPYNEEIENKKLLLNQHKIVKNNSYNNIFKNKKESFCKNDCCQFLNKYPWICPQCNKEHKCPHYRCQNCRKSLCFCKKK